MATLRCSKAFVVRLVIHATVVVATGAGFPGVGVGEEAQSSSAPRTLMRIPRWIESLGDRAARPPRPLPANQSASTPVAPQTPETPVALPATPQPASADPASDTAELAIASTPASSADGKPGRALVRSRASKAVDAHALLTSGWTDVAPGESSAAKPEETPAALPAVANDSTASLATATATEAERSAEPAVPTEVPATVPSDIESPDVSKDQPDVPADPIGQPEASGPDDTPTLAVDPASFRGVYPGKTTREELEASWGTGKAFTREDGSSGFFWKIDPFDRVEVTLDGEAVGSIRIKLAEPVAVADLAKQLDIADLRTVSVLDENGVSIGEVFPERGVIFSVQPGTQSALAVMLEPLDPESFVLRAEGEIDTNTAFAAADLHQALEIDPKHLRALRLLLALKCEQGRWEEAAALAERAETIDPADIWTQLKHAGVLVALEQGAEAHDKVESVRNQPNASPLVTAQAERMLGRIELAAAKPDYQKAVEHFANAIRTSSPLVGNKSVSVQKAARDVLLDAHLGTALAIAKGTWQQKARVIPKWITRSETIVNDLNPKAEDKDTLELQLCRGALAVAAGSTEAVDPLPWVKRLLDVRKRMDGSVTDGWRRRQLDWEIGQGLADALSAAQKRGDAADMLENSTLTAAYLDRGREHRQLTASERKNIGDLMFRIGILYSLQEGDHATAVTWFDKALPLWDDNPAFARDGEMGRLGESFVSMAISYWQVDRREDAVAISRKGVDLMVEAVDQQQLDERSLAVAYGNLSTMYAEQGDEEKSRNYAELASRAESTGTVVK